MTGVSTVATSAVELNSTVQVETTVSLAMKPTISEVAMRQSAKPSGANSGATQPATSARMDCDGSSTKRRDASKLLRNHTSTLATKMTVNARVRKSLDLSHTSRPTLLALGRR